MLSITRFSRPVLSDLPALHSRLNRMFDDAFRVWPFPNELGGTSLAGSWIPPVDVVEDKDAVRITAELPGMKPEDVKISLENDLLTIRGEKRQVVEESGDHAHRYERSYGMFERSFTLPSTVDADHIQATFADLLADTDREDPGIFPEEAHLRSVLGQEAAGRPLAGDLVIRAQATTENTATATARGQR